MSRLKVSTELRFLKIPVVWTTSEIELSGRSIALFTPNLSRADAVTVDGWDLRRKFLRMEHTAKAALGFLSEVGLWTIDWRAPVTSRRYFNGTYGSRHCYGDAAITTLPNLIRLQKYAVRLMEDRAALIHEFGPTPGQMASYEERRRHALRTAFINQLPLHIEWRKKAPFAVIETATGWEMISATTQFDLLRGAKFKPCAREDCRIPFPMITRHAKIYCSQSCAHVMAMRKKREKGQ